MKRQTLSIVLMLVLAACTKEYVTKNGTPTTSPLSSDGTISGGGGQGVVCRDANGAVKTVELLDLWEAKHIYNREIKISDESVDDQFSAAVRRLQYFVDYPVDSTTTLPDGTQKREIVYDHFITRLPMAAYDVIGYSTKDGKDGHKRNVNLTLTKDAHDQMTPADPNCQIEQLVIFNDDPIGPSSALVNQDLVDKMDKTNQAALAVHESVYWWLRMTSFEKNSLRTRRIVGFVMSGGVFPAQTEAQLSKPYVACRTQFDEDAFNAMSLEDQDNFDVHGNGSAIYFGNVKDKYGNPRVKMFVSNVDGVYFVELSDDIHNPYEDVETMMSEIAKSSKGARFEMRSDQSKNPNVEAETKGSLYVRPDGSATARMTAVVGEQSPLPVDKHIKCELVK
jgi:hypothetical protein